jgi:hypothetical protein
LSIKGFLSIKKGICLQEEEELIIEEEAIDIS